MRQAYAHDAVVVMDQGSDDRAPGGAITLALCGTWEHNPPCPLAAHHTAVETRGDELHLRVLYATAPHRVADVRERIEAALTAGGSTGPDGRISRWRLVRSGCATLEERERPHARRLLLPAQ
jgi:hypothetical protein